MAVPRPKWFSDNFVMISTAPTCGLTKGGRLLRKIDPRTGKRVQVKDPDTNEFVDEIDDELLGDAYALAKVVDVQKEADLTLTETLSFVRRGDLGLAVPVYYDHRVTRRFRAAMA